MAKKEKNEGIETLCVKQCYDAGKLWNPGDPRRFPDAESVSPHFQYKNGKGELITGPPEKSFSQLSVEGYRKLAEKEEIEIPEDITKRDELKEFLAAALKEKNAKKE